MQIPIGNEVMEFLKSSAVKPVRTSIQSLWQNGPAEPWVGSARREPLDHIIPLNEYHQDRTHIGLNKNTPTERAVESRSPYRTRVVSRSRLGGGPHHRYSWSELA
jgi:hypothetical protein